MLKKIYQMTDNHALKLLLTGGAAIAWYNWQQWQHDKALLRERSQPAALPPLEQWHPLPLVSVLVAAWNEAEHITRFIESFLALRYPNKELILCAGGSDGTYQLACRVAGRQIKVYEQQPGQGKQRALHRSLPKTSGTIIFLTDADCDMTNESFERTLYPVAKGYEQVSTGSYRPKLSALANPFVMAQAASQLYGTLNGGHYSDGLCGANCAIERKLLEESEGFAQPAPTGTDYVLAKTLVRAGARIRQVPESRMLTDYPTTIGAYMRQQRRWLRNVALHGHRFGAYSEVKASMQTSLTGLAMLLLPLAGLKSSSLLVVWLLLLWHAFLSRLRYLYMMASLFGITLDLRQLVLQPGMLFLDFIAWSQPLLDYLFAKRRKEW